MNTLHKQNTARPMAAITLALAIMLPSLACAQQFDAGVSAELATYMVEKNKPIVILDK